MKLITLDNFPADFRKEDVEKILKLAQIGRFCQLICIPGAGKATLLKLLAANESLKKAHLGSKLNLTRIIYLDLHELPTFNEADIEKFVLFGIDEKITPEQEPVLLAKQLNRAFSSLVEKDINVIFLLDHFDEFQNQLPISFYRLLDRLRTLNKYKFATVFGTRRDLRELVDPHLLKDFYDFFVDNSIYLKIYDQKALDVLFSQIEQAFGKKLTNTQKEAIVKLTGGHGKLAKTISEIWLKQNTKEDQETLLKEPLINEALSELWLFLTAQEQQCLKKITSGQKPDDEEIFQRLIRFDLLSGKGTFTIPLFEEFVKAQKPDEQKITYKPETKEILKGEKVISDLLSKQEYRLLKFLISNEGKVTTRDELITSVWPDAQQQEGISDEAIDQMIFRLRKKIEDEPNLPKHLTTVKGQGFRFTA